MPGQKKYDRSDIRRLNGVSVLNQLRRHGPMSRANIANGVGLTRATVSNIVADFLEIDLIEETEYVAGSAGRPGLLLNLNESYGSMIAVEIDLDRISIQLTDLGLKVLFKDETRISVNQSREQVLTCAEKLLDEAMRVANRKQIKCVGIGVALAGLVDRKEGQLAYGPTSGWEDVPIRSRWQKRFMLPVYVENEAHAGAIGTYHFGVAQGRRNMVYLSLGVGLAAGIYCDGQLVRGKFGFAGQVGHTFFKDNGVRCVCGKYGCWLTEIGAVSVHQKLRKAGADLPHLDEKHGMDWVEAATEQVEAGNEIVYKELKQIGQLVGQGLASTVLTINPAIVVIGGRMAPLMKYVEDVIRLSLMAAVMPQMLSQLEVVVSDTGDDQLKGCLATVFDTLMNNPEI